MNQSNLINNPYPQNIFLFVQLVSLILFAFELPITYAFNSDMHTPSYNNKNIFILWVMILLTLLTYMTLRGFKTYKKDVFCIKFPWVAHFFLCILEVIYFYYEGSQFQNPTQLREAGSQLSGVFKVTTVLFYMTTAFLFLYVEKYFSSFSYKFKALILLVIIATFIIFLIKDIVFTSRGNVFLFFCLYISGKFYFYKKFKLKEILKLRYFILLTLFLMIIGLLTLLRHELYELSYIYDSIIFKFVGNISNVYDFFSGTLKIRVLQYNQYNEENFLVGHVYSQWIAISEIGLYKDIISKFDFFYTLPNFINKYFMFNNEFVAKKIYFNIYGDSPFNSANYILRFIVFGPIGLLLLVAILRFPFVLCKINPSFRFFSFVILILFSLSSFMSLPLIEMPYMLIPLLSFTFSYHLKVENNVEV